MNGARAQPKRFLRSLFSVAASNRSFWPFLSFPQASIAILIFSRMCPYVTCLREVPCRLVLSVTAASDDMPSLRVYEVEHLTEEGFCRPACFIPMPHPLCRREKRFRAAPLDDIDVFPVEAEPTKLYGLARSYNANLNLSEIRG